MHKVLIRSAFCIIFLVLFTCLCAFADDKLWTEQDIKNQLSLTGFRNCLFESNVVPTFSFGKFYNNPNLTVYTNEKYSIVTQNIAYVFPSNPIMNGEKQDVIYINIPLYLENISSFDFTFFVTVQGNNANRNYCTEYPSAYWQTEDDIAYVYGYNNKSSLCTVRRNGYNYFPVPHSNALSNGQIVFEKYTVHGAVPNSMQGSVRYIRVPIVCPFELISRQHNNTSITIVLGLIPDNPTFILYDPQIASIQSNLDSIQSELIANGDKLDDVIAGIDNVGDRILYEVSAENRLVVRNLKSKVDRVKEQTAEIVDGLSGTDSYMESADDILLTVDPSHILPEGYEEGIQSVNEVLSNAFENTPLELMMIISLSLALISYILFGKKGSA